MKVISRLVLLATLGISAASVTIAAPPQDRPGFPTKASVWVENRAPEEAIPVRLVRTPTEQPIRVDIGTPTVQLPANSVIDARQPRQPWEYRSIVVPTGQDLAASLNTAGQEGWEPSGVQITATGGTTIVLKRPR